MFLFVSTKYSFQEIKTTNKWHFSASVSSHSPLFILPSFSQFPPQPLVSTHHFLFLNFSKIHSHVFIIFVVSFILIFFELCCCVSVSRVHVCLPTISLKGLRISIPFAVKLRKNAIFIESAAAESNAADGSESESKKEGDVVSVEKQLMKRLKFCCC